MLSVYFRTPLFIVGLGNIRPNDEDSNAVHRLLSSHPLVRFTRHTMMTIYNMRVCVAKTTSPFGTLLLKNLQFDCTPSKEFPVEWISSVLATLEEDGGRLSKEWGASISMIFIQCVYVSLKVHIIYHFISTLERNIQPIRLSISFILL